MSNSTCIDADPDITGIGVRTAVYAQNIFSFIPALRILWDGRITRNELDTIEEQSATILVTAFALLFTTIIQARGHSGLSNFHATIILNLSWMNNTNVFIYLLIYVYHRKQHLDKQSEILSRPSRLRILREEAEKIIKNPVFWIGSLHLTFMGAVGIWLWSSPAAFGHSPSCALNTSVVFFGKRVSLSSKGLQVWSILTYSTMLTPVLNMILPSAVTVLGSFHFFQPDHHEKPLPGLLVSMHTIETFWRSTQPVRLGLLLLLSIDVFLMVNTELALTENGRLLGDGNGAWTFGQVLALMLLLVPAWNFVGILLERRDARQKKIKNLVSQILDGDLGQAQKLLDQEPEDNAKDLALVLAATTGHLDMVKILYEFRTGQHSGGQLALLIAASQGHSDIVHWLARQPLGIKPENKRLVEPLISISSHEPVWFVKTLADLSLGLNVEAKEVMDALKHAAEIEVGFNALVSSIQDVHLKNGLGQTPLHLVAIHGTLQGATYLIGKGAKIDATDHSGMTPLYLAASRNAQDIVEYLVECDADIAVKNELGDTLLHMAVKENYLRLLKILRPKFKNPMVETRNNEGLTPLYLAASLQRDEEYIKCLDPSGTDMDAQDELGNTLLHTAVKRGDLDVLKIPRLISKILMVKNKHGQTPLHMAVLEGAVNIVRCLVELGADVDERVDLGNTLLHVVALRGDSEIMQILVSKSKNLDARNDLEGLTPLYLAAKQEAEDCVKCLLSRDADMDAKDEKGNTLLHRAITRGDFHVVQILAPRSKNVTAKNESGQTPLHMAASKGALDIVHCLINKGARVNVEDKSGQTPLHLAASQGFVTTVKFLVARGADVDAKNLRGENSSQVALEAGHHDVHEFLETTMPSSRGYFLQRLS